MDRRPTLSMNPDPAEVESMACVLEGQHGAFAARIAEFFSTYHSLGGDENRSSMWSLVAHSIRHREQERLALR